MGSAQSTRRRAPTHRLADTMGQSQTVDSDVSREGYEKAEEDGHSLEENPSKIHSVEKDVSASSEDTEIKYSIPIVTVTDASPNHSPNNKDPADYFRRDTNYLDIAQEASDTFGLGESPVIFARYPHPKPSQPDLPCPTNLLKPPRTKKTRASSIGLERKPDLEDVSSAKPKTISGGFKATEGYKEDETTVPCVFKWTPKSAAAIAKLASKQSVAPQKDGFCSEPCDETGKMYTKRPLLKKPKQVNLSGDFNSWQLIPLSNTFTSSCFVTIIELPLGTHQYKFVVDGDWTFDPTLPSVDDGIGGKNNIITVNSTDRDAFDALDVDMKCISKSSSDEFSQDIPHPNPPVSSRGRQRPCPPVLPPHLLQVMLNKDTPLVCEPTLLPTPNHVMINHMYALSFKDNVIVLSETSRYRKKYATTVFYKPTV